MPVSKRLRFEILRRDGHTCRYCGCSAPEVKLTVDHVVAVALGGSDDPSNLVAACADCNNGKSSLPADAPLVADVAADALRWATAIELVANARAAKRAESAHIHAAFIDKWNTWTFRRGIHDYHFNLPGNWRASVERFLDLGLQMDDLHELVDVAMGSRSDDPWRYFCGCCWRRVEQAQKEAREIVEFYKDADWGHNG